MRILDSLTQLSTSEIMMITAVQVFKNDKIITILHIFLPWLRSKYLSVMLS